MKHLYHQTYLVIFDCLYFPFPLELAKNNKYKQIKLFWLWSVHFFNPI